MVFAKRLRNWIRLFPVPALTKQPFLTNWLPLTLFSNKS